MNRIRRSFCALALLAVCFSAHLLGLATSANSGTVRGSIVDPSGAAIAGASVEIRNPVSGYDQKTTADAKGAFEFDNVPFNPYHVSVIAANFQSAETDVDVKASVPIQLMPISLKIGTSTTTVEVVEAADL